MAESVCGYGDSLDLNVAAIGHSEFPDVGCAEFESAYDRTDSNGRKVSCNCYLLDQETFVHINIIHCVC